MRMEGCPFAGSQACVQDSHMVILQDHLVVVRSRDHGVQRIGVLRHRSPHSAMTSTVAEFGRPAAAFDPNLPSAFDPKLPLAESRSAWAKSSVSFGGFLELARVAVEPRAYQAANEGR